MKSIIFGLVLLVSAIYLSNEEINHQDCTDAFQICESGSYLFETMIGFGLSQEIIKDQRCSQNSIVETNSKWLKFHIESSGSLSFVIDPLSERDDIDFVLFKSIEKDCNDLQEIRCMSSGTTYRNDGSKVDCLGSTGLSLNSLDEFEKAGCKFNDDNFLKYLSAEKSETYYLLVNNYNSGAGFNFSIEGDAKLKQTQCEENESTFYSIETYPNPTNNILNVKMNIANIEANQAKIYVYDFEGKLVRTFSQAIAEGKNSFALDVSNLITGQYLLEIHTDSKQFVKQFIKQ